MDKGYNEFMGQNKKIKFVALFMATIIFICGGGLGYFMAMNSINKTNINTEGEIKISPTPIISHFSDDEIFQAQEMELSQKRCGDFPEIKERQSQSSTRKSISEVKWSPNCKYVLWYQYSLPFTGGWIDDNDTNEKLKASPTPRTYVAKKDEGVFLFNTCNSNSERIYIPKSEIGIGNINWIDNNQLSFFADKTNFIYSLIEKKYVENKNN